MTALLITLSIFAALALAGVVLDKSISAEDFADDGDEHDPYA